MSSNRLIQVSQQTYTNSTPVPQDLGGIESGDTFSDETMTQMFDQLLYPYIAPSVNLSVTPTNSLREYGDNITSVDLSANTTKNTNDITSVEFFRDGSSIHVVSSPSASGGTETYTDSTGVSSNTTYRVDVSDGTQTVSDSESYNFVYPYYHGTGAPGLTPSEVQNLTKLIESKSNKVVYESPSSEVYYFAYPASYGSLSSILDSNGFEIIGDFTETDETFSMLDGTDQTYKVYEFNNLTTQTDFKITYKY